MLFFCYFVLLVVSVSAVPKTQIVDGSVANDCEFPSIVYIRIYLQSSGSAFSICGGALIDSTHVLTAAHCVTGDIKKVKVSIGSNLRSRKSNSRSVSNIVKHSEYTNILGDPEDYIVKNDIAILTLNQSVSEGNCVRFASLASQGETFGTSRCIAAGWGRLAPDGNIPDALYKVPLPIVPHDECKKNSIMQISEGVLCAGDFVLGGASTCHGDSGGPLYCPNSNGEMVLAGVNSFGYECDEDINAFTDVGYFRNWIQTHL